MFADIQPDPDVRPEQIAGHSCARCLIGTDAAKRACALRRMLADGHSAPGIEAFRSAQHTSQ
jgi:hypothetical protein